MAQRNDHDYSVKVRRSRRTCHNEILMIPVPKCDSHDSHSTIFLEVVAQWYGATNDAAIFLLAHLEANEAGVLLRYSGSALINNLLTSILRLLRLHTMMSMPWVISAQKRRLADVFTRNELTNGSIRSKAEGGMCHFNE
ncbi:hypothetical protein MAR_006369 [Mya arenaria]|uniref:Uncharacterized protein n=1 Tax=Mya arenaria TaxID=6604 RepID=A0ABY7DCT5_MYAAR|nr:hypothetical protein MAR_006369 [Mya arenaria]